MFYLSLVEVLGKRGRTLLCLLDVEAYARSAPRRAIMTCSRCSGLTVEDHFLDFEGSYGQMWTASWRCVNCGRVHDSAIELNRLLRQEKVLELSSSEPDFQDDEVHLGAESFIRRAA